MIFEILFFQKFLLPQLLRIPKFFSTKISPILSIKTKTSKTLVKNHIYLVLFDFYHFLCIRITNTR